MKSKFLCKLHFINCEIFCTWNFPLFAFFCNSDFHIALKLIKYWDAMFMNVSSFKRAVLVRNRDLALQDIFYESAFQYSTCIYISFQEISTSDSFNNCKPWHQWCFLLRTKHFLLLFSLPELNIQVIFSDYLSSVCKLFIFFSRTTGLISTKLSTKHPWAKGIQVCSNEGPPFPKGDNYKIAKIH